MEIKQKKNDERKKFLTLRREFSASDDRTKRDSLICKAIIESASFRYSDILLTYSPVGFEINVAEVIRLSVLHNRTPILLRKHKVFHNPKKAFLRLLKNLI